MTKKVTMLGKSDCFLACIAMAVGKPLAKIFPKEFRQRIEKRKGTFKDDIEQVFKYAKLVEGQHYVKVTMFDWDSSRWIDLLWGRKAIIQVPSLNRKNSNHGVFWDGHKLIDPNPEHCNRYTRLVQLNAQHIWLFK